MFTRSLRRAPPGVRRLASLPRALSTLTSSDIEHFLTFLPSNQVQASLSPGSTPQDELASYNTDWMGKYIGGSRCVLRPRTTEEVSRIVRHCYERGLGVVPQGGNTGLVGGGVPKGADEVVINLGLMNQIRGFNASSGVLTADAGCVLQTLNTFLTTKGHVMPLDLGAKGSCQIGGNVSTNAGGLRMVRYGSLHANVLGLEVVMPDGRVVHGLRGLRKDNTGYHLHHLFIGAEGTLGVVTGVSLLTPPLSPSVNLALLRLPDYASVLAVFGQLRSKLGEILSAVEYFDHTAWAVVNGDGEAGKEVERQVFGADDVPPGVNLIIETSGSVREHDEAKLSLLLEELLEGPHVLTGSLAQDETQLARMWELREGIAEACGKAGKVYKYDVSVPIQEWENVLETLRARAEEKSGGLIERVVGFGHIGDGNLHINVVCSRYDKQIEQLLEPFMFELVASKKGSISAEHGLGVQKAKYIHYSKTPLEIELMRTIKNAFDPKGIMNPGKVVLPVGAGVDN
ncbi:FAD-binding domain-containing protein [Calocera viscosa TUFC12733]|uniref:FAD-binding domain-containing protein n=1 Tax=Calocera viscosa (strain TUFC12733) TaxID=1330018 RepID=A0A167JD09_CALVF|nr:FAD-binding domain-containing protein [Calocera viscosa TUFC12733]